MGDFLSLTRLFVRFLQRLLPRFRQHLLVTLRQLVFALASLAPFKVRNLQICELLTGT